MTIEVEPAAKLDAKGRCCGRKPLYYRTYRGAGTRRDPHHFCCVCDREFWPSGEQRPNWAWMECEGGFAHRKLAKAEERK